jgi:hypothetical protein
MASAADFGSETRLALRLDGAKIFRSIEEREQVLPGLLAESLMKDESLDWLPVVDESNDSWPDPASLKGELPPVEPFSEDLLPASLRPLVCDIADRMQTPLDYPAAAGNAPSRATLDFTPTDFGGGCGRF